MRCRHRGIRPASTVVIDDDDDDDDDDIQPLATRAFRFAIRINS